MKFDQNTFRLTETKSTEMKALIFAIAGLLISAVGYFINSQQFFYSYLTAWLFWVSIGIGGLFFVLLFHLTGTVWGVVIRRILETLMMTLPWMLLLFVPIFFGLHDVYHWSHSEAVAQDAILQKKSGYLNVPFFTVRTVFYFIVWFLIARTLYKKSISVDKTPNAQMRDEMKKISAPGMLIFALTTSFAAFDWMMSLDPHWYSTIYGLYFFSGSVVAVIGFLILFAIYLNKKNILKNIITAEHYHDLAKFLFGFIIFWGYMAFSQYMLIWYANIPEETIFYLHRWEGSWKIFTMALVFGHFVFPFIGLLARSSKRNLKYLRLMSFFVLVMHWIDLYWNVVPNLHHHGIHLCWMDLTLFLGIGGLFMFIFWKYFSANAIVPYNDSRFAESVKHEIL
jgi:hypothetical protein